jgi:carnitine-CoA ligase
MDRGQFLPGLLIARAESEPDSILLEEVGGRRQTSGEFLQTTRRWSSAFEQLGVGHGQTVASILPNVLEAYHHWIGLAWLPAIDVPINEQYRGDLLVHAMNNSDASILVTTSQYLPPVLDVASRLNQLGTIVVIDEDSPMPHGRFRMLGISAFLGGTKPLTRPGPDASDPFGIIYTSGTTGASKGIRGTWPELASALEGTFPGDKAGDYPGGAYYSPWRSCHMTSKTALDFALRLNFRLVLRDTFTVSSFWDDVRAYGCTHFLLAFIAPWLWSAERRPDDASNPMCRVSMVPLMPEFREFGARFGVRVTTTWASSEAGWPLAAADPVDYRSCGRVVPGYHVKLIGPDGSAVAPGETGEMLVRHDEPERLFAGYHNLPEATGAVMAGGWYHTGDAFTVDEDGNYFFVDRIKDYIKHHGQSISASEVEEYVLANEEVFECACIGVPSRDATEGVIGDEEVKIIVALRGGGYLAPRDLITDLIARMPRFMVPRYVEVVDALPRNHVNKIAKARLRKDALNDRTWDRVAAGISLPRRERPLRAGESAPAKTGNDAEAYPPHGWGRASRETGR